MLITYVLLANYTVRENFKIVRGIDGSSWIQQCGEYCSNTVCGGFSYDSNYQACFIFNLLINTNFKYKYNTYSYVLKLSDQKLCNQAAGNITQNGTCSKLFIKDV